MIAGVRGKELGDARSLGVSDVLAIDDDTAIEKFPLVDAIADTVGGEVAAEADREGKVKRVFLATLLPCRKARRYKIRR